MCSLTPLLKIEKLPFFIGPFDPKNIIDIPDSFPFHLGIHSEFAIPALIMTDEINNALSRVYSFGSMVSTPLGESQLSKTRMLEVLGTLLDLFDGDVRGAKFLEVGCGGGALLYELKIRGADVAGIEIGPQGVKAREKYGLRIVQEAFGTNSFKEKFDCICSYGCLEHIVELDEFFVASRSCLEEGGLMFHAVPNSEIYFNTGSLGHLIHQHVNYFTRTNAICLYDSQGFHSAQTYESTVSNVLFIAGYYDQGAKLFCPGDNAEIFLEESRKISEYADKLNSKIKNVVMAIEKMQLKSESIGFYAGGFEYSMFLEKIKSIRYFDGDPYKHGKVWLPRLSCIESPTALNKYPVDNLIICKEYYYNDIVKYLRNEVKINDTVKIHKIDDLSVK